MATHRRRGAQKTTANLSNTDPPLLSLLDGREAHVQNRLSIQCPRWVQWMRNSLPIMILHPT